MTTVRYGSALTRSPGLAAAPVAGLPGVADLAGLPGVADLAGLPGVADLAGLAGLAAVAWAAISLPSRADSQHRPASSANRPRKTAPCALAGPAPLSQCAPSGTPSRSWVSSVFTVPPTVGERNSRYM